MLNLSDEACSTLVVEVTGSCWEAVKLMFLVLKKKVSFSTNNEKIRDLFSTHLENFQLEVVIDDGDGWGWHP